ncbi:MAG: hypothetical protein ACLSCV_04545 [Acutalibacteraceae bacterium]
MTWGTSDILALIENSRYFCGSERIPFSNNMSICSYCEQMLHYDATKQMGLSTSAQLLGINEEDIAHHVPWTTVCCRCGVCKNISKKHWFLLQDARTDAFYEKSHLRR